MEEGGRGKRGGGVGVSKLTGLREELLSGYLEVTTSGCLDKPNG